VEHVHGCDGNRGEDELIGRLDMCDLSHDRATDFGFIVDAPQIRSLIAETERVIREIPGNAARVEALRGEFAALLAADGWLPDEFAQPDRASGMGGGIGQYALYRAVDGSLCLFSLVVPAGASTPVHDHLAWGIVGVYRGTQLDTTYARLDDGHDEARASLEVSSQQTVGPGNFYTLLPPEGDIHYVRTISGTPSVSIHLLANDTACVWRHKFDPDAGTVSAFRSGYSNVRCPDPSPKSAA
jgi:predicted metal-dependent enzyme (double-stranded beta helix superfamily)